MREGVGNIGGKEERKREKKLRRRSVLSLSLLEKHTQGSRIHTKPKIPLFGPSS